MLTVADMRPVLGIEEDQTFDDALIQFFLDGAKAHMARHLRRDIDAEFGPNYPPDLLVAQTMLTAHFYAHREAVAAGAKVGVPLGFDALMADFRSFT
ncbi:head-tail connector protein [Thalassococcus sp. S3]|uniref:head-tail connector protein n=1 Tax=Thalassococcus sp. S3 TaxID=2017482 RepID=UPI00102460F2|nr:head-tail connector protein [Thalassococcus sp. S3]QBF32149.1 hypothetical protein CFI11_13100 [Thalassococcus sp. S3]